jgi:type IV secretory pathway VirB2 component (pilin)
MKILRTVVRSLGSAPVVVASLAVLLLAAPGFAQGASPWENAVNVLQQAFTSTIARGLSLVAIVVAGLTFAFEPSRQILRIHSTSSSTSNAGLAAGTFPKFCSSSDTTLIRTCSITVRCSLRNRTTCEHRYQIRAAISDRFGVRPRTVRA